VISHWTDRKNDVLEFTCDDQSMLPYLQDAIRELTRKLGVRISRNIAMKPTQQIVMPYRSLNDYKFICTIIERNHCLQLLPCIYKGGWEWYRIIAFSEADIRNLFRELEKFCKVQAISRKRIDSAVRNSFLISMTDLLGRLTEKQIRALMLAIENGYYRIPKRITTVQIANKSGMARTTFEEHLRKAESKILGSVRPYLELRSRTH